MASVRKADHINLNIGIGDVDFLIKVLDFYSTAGKFVEVEEGEDERCKSIAARLRVLKANKEGRMKLDEEIRSFAGQPKDTGSGD